MKPFIWKFIPIIIIGAKFLTACQFGAAPSVRPNPKTTIVVTYSVLGAVVKDLVGDEANVIVLIPNGQDPHEWEPSAKDIETVNKANLVVQNGLGLEGGLTKTLDQARSSGVKFFTASDAITVRKVGEGEGIPNGDPDQSIGALDPHLWLDPVNMVAIVSMLTVQLKNDLGIDVAERAANLKNRLDVLNDNLSAEVATLPQENRKLVTGHESMGYFAQRYGFQLIGAIIPSLTTQAEVSASDLAALKQSIVSNHVKSIFTELGTPKAVVDAIGQETGVNVVQITTHVLPEDGSYFTLMTDLTSAIVGGLR
jgi:zinc/manganese transport system substrate-binding protein